MAPELGVPGSCFPQVRRLPIAEHRKGGPAGQEPLQGDVSMDRGPEAEDLHLAAISPFLEEANLMLPAGI